MGSPPDSDAPARRARGPVTRPSIEGVATHLCAVAAALFNRRGIRAVSVEDIVDDARGGAGVSKPILYRTYPSKDGLVLDCLARAIHHGEARWGEIARDAKGDPLLALQMMVTDITAQISSHTYRGDAVTNAAAEFPEPIHPARVMACTAKARLREHFHHLANRTAPCVPQGLGDGIFPVVEGASSSRHASPFNGPANRFRSRSIFSSPQCRLFRSVSQLCSSEDPRQTLSFLGTAPKTVTCSSELPAPFA